MNKYLTRITDPLEPIADLLKKLNQHVGGGVRYEIRCTGSSVFYFRLVRVEEGKGKAPFFLTDWIGEKELIAIMKAMPIYSEDRSQVKQSLVKTNVKSDVDGQ